MSIREFAQPTVQVSKDFAKWFSTISIERAQNLIQTREVNPKLQTPEEHRNFLKSFQSMIQQGLLTLYRGALPKIIAFAPVAITPILADYFEEHYQMKPRMAGVIANTISYLIRYPFDYAFTKLATQCHGEGEEPEYQGIWDLLSRRIKQDGFLSIYKGMGLSLVGIVVSHMISAAVVMGLRLKPSYTALNFRRITFVLTIRFTLYPFDTVRKRLIVTDTHPDEKKRGWRNPDLLKNLYAGFSYSLITGVYSLVSVLYISAEADREVHQEMERRKQEQYESYEMERIKAQAHADAMRDIYRGDGSSGYENIDPEYEEYEE